MYWITHLSFFSFFLFFYPLFLLLFLLQHLTIPTVEGSENGGPSVEMRGFNLERRSGPFSDSAKKHPDGFATCEAERWQRGCARRRGGSRDVPLSGWRQGLRGLNDDGDGGWWNCLGISDDGRSLRSPLMVVSAGSVLRCCRREFVRVSCKGLGRNRVRGSWFRVRSFPRTSDGLGSECLRSDCWSTRGSVKWSEIDLDEGVEGGR